MQHLLITTMLCFTCLFFSQTAGASPASPNDSLLNGIEQTIDRKFVSSLARGQVRPLAELITQLEQGRTLTRQPLYRYWQAYALFWQAIYHMQQEDTKEAEKATDAAIALLKKSNNKTAEDYALLGFLQGFSIPFKASLRAPFISAQASKNARIALEMQPDNARAYYVLGNNDYYTPAQFGGGEKVEEYLRKAIELAAAQTPNPYLPAWGGEQAYEMLIRFYEREREDQQLEQTLAAALRAYPDSFRLNELAGNLN
ncbi:MAG TPA: hypothetical protein VJ953_22245 [Saprospiraceae bacterium]|nr:hypothetical protein [Saprospiraceae bacterium]